MRQFALGALLATAIGSGVLLLWNARAPQHVREFSLQLPLDASGSMTANVSLADLDDDLNDEP